MANKCKICNDPDKLRIEKAYLNGTSLRNISGQTGHSKSALHRHFSDHIPGQLVNVSKEKQIAESADLLSELEVLRSEMKDIFDRNKGKDDKIAISALNSQTKLYDLLSKVVIELQRQRQYESQNTIEGIRAMVQQQTEQEVKEGLVKLTDEEKGQYFKLLKKMIEPPTNVNTERSDLSPSSNESGGDYVDAKTIEDNAVKGTQQSRDEYYESIKYKELPPEPEDYPTFEKKRFVRARKL